MALQGTIDAFPLTDVLHLLSTSARSGRFELEGDRGSAALCIEGGSVVGGAPVTSGAAPATAASLVFDMLRFSDGAFVFDVVAAEPGDVVVDPVPLAECLDAARAMAEEWAAVAAVVPSPAHVVSLNPTLPGGTVTLDERTWRVVVSAGRRPSVAALLDELGTDELEGSKAIAGLVERGLVHVTAPVESLFAPEAEPAVHVTVAEEPAVVNDFPDHFPIDDFIGSEHGDANTWAERTLQTEVSEGVDAGWDALIDEALDEFDAAVAPGLDDEPSPTVSVFEAEPAQVTVSMGPGTDEAAEPVAAQPDSTDEVLRQMARLSPQAAEAIAAALSTAAEPDGASLTDGTDHDASFLGSR